MFHFMRQSLGKWDSQNLRVFFYKHSGNMTDWKDIILQKIGGAVGDVYVQYKYSIQMAFFPPIL